MGECLLIGVLALSGGAQLLSLFPGGSPGNLYPNLCPHPTKKAPEVRRLMNPGKAVYMVSLGEQDGKGLGLDWTIPQRLVSKILLEAFRNSEESTIRI